MELSVADFCHLCNKRDVKISTSGKETLTKQQFVDILNECKKQFTIDSTRADNIFTLKEAVDCSKDKCWTSCWLNKSGIMNKGKIDVEKTIKWHRVLWDTADQQILADQNSLYCSERLKGSDDCEVSCNHVKCFKSHAAEIGLKEFQI